MSCQIVKSGIKAGMAAASKLARSVSCSAQRIEPAFGSLVRQPATDTFIKSCNRLPSKTSALLHLERTGVIDTTKHAALIQEAREEMKIALECVDKDLAKRLIKTGDIYTTDEIINIDYLIKTSKAEYSVDDIIRCHGDLSLLNLSKGNVHFRNVGELEENLNVYVNNLSRFKSKDAASLGEYTKKINRYIRDFGIAIPEKVMYRGEMSEAEINRMISLCEQKIANPTEQIIYNPNHLFSTSTSLDAIANKGRYAEKCLVEIVDPKGKARVLDVNAILKSKNDFKWQQEYIFPSDSSFEVIEGFYDNGRLVVRLKLI